MVSLTLSPDRIQPLDSSFKGVSQSNGTAPPYPPALMEAYYAYTEKELAGTLTPEEEAQFTAVQEQINALDRQRPRPDVWDIQHAKIRAELNALEAAVDALSDAG